MLIDNKDLPRGYISFSAWNLWNTSQDKFYAKYVLGEEERRTEALILGKKFAEAQELKNGKYGEIEIECVTSNGLKIYGKCDYFDGEKIIDDKTSRNFKNIHKRAEEQILFYQLIVYRSFNKIVDGEIHHYQTRDDMAILMGEAEIDEKPTIYKCKKPTVKKLLTLEKKLEKDAINIINYIKWKSSK